MNISRSSGNFERQMYMNDIVFMIKFSEDISSIDQANEYLAKGWKLLHVGTETSTEMLNDGTFTITTAYVLGANQKQYDDYVQERTNKSSSQLHSENFFNFDDEQ